ncbi:vanadium-dependent haloperoxidase [Solirubrobacter soli]|uniref:vanadium-dependent haloperoxidase n=1 Tax=Solirubrobacter soli TaxID=363832 RepID=UPI00040A4ACD|nr:vanadium-dependent haloperoxidase [Solirubrobacter soli]
MRHTLATLGVAALTCAALASVPTASPAATRTQTTSDPVIDWNRFLLGVQATPGQQPATVQPTYELAVMHKAIYDAVVSIGRGGASIPAAVDAAAHDTLVVLYPSLKASIDQQYTTSLNQVPNGIRRGLGVKVGQLAAARLLRERANDGSTAAPLPFTPGTQPGDYQLTPPAFAPPAFTHWSAVRPFVLRRANQFRPPAPPALTSAKYAAAIDEVKALGVAAGSTRTPDQTQIGQFWNPPIWATWNRIAQTAALGHHGTISENARTFAALNLTFADTVIAFYDAKYTYRFWRPVTAIRATTDPAWTPLSNTAPDPSYPGAHGAISAAGADVLSALYGNDFDFTVDSTALPGVLRGFVSFTEAAEEASVSRIYNGNHTRIDQVAGENLGHNVARFVLRSQALRELGT